ncbi:LAQU0S03e04940g1_1 [Lachancea quebecensis]|uniref:LAQU0S03e04940g1_1 n=1 Tax=Lachancea quebecensis TaxID=1654605 RepID=A0A0P1KRM0_9SACH|nr:LAQU0S03e04940g1_1 [Lachancea quebecensis]
MEAFIDQVPHAVTIGIDTYSFEVKPGQPFHGIKNIPREPALHVVHFQHSDNGTRYGYWFESDAQHYVEFTYDREKEIFVPRTLSSDSDRSDGQRRFEQVNALMVAYPALDEEDSWYELTKHIRWPNVQRIAGCSSKLVYVDSAMTTSEENKNILKALSKSGQTQMDAATSTAEPILNYTPIVFKSREAIRDDHKMEDFLDKSYYLHKVVLPHHHRNSMRSLLGELQWAFLNAMLFGSYGSSLQWHNVLELVCCSSTVSQAHVSELDNALSRELRVVPELYVDTLLNEEVWVRCLDESFQGPYLQKTAAAARELLPALNNASDDGANYEAYEGALSRDQGLSDDDPDEPVVAERVLYRRR